MSGQGYNGAGVYVFRTRRPGLIGRVPAPISAGIVLVLAGVIWHYTVPWLAPLALLASSRHTAYVGLSRHVRSRRDQHLKGSIRYNALPKPWADLDPSWYFLPLVLPWDWLLQTAETLLILATWPIYNHQKNLWNLRRIPIKAAKRQRGQRDFAGWSFNFRYAHALLWAVLFATLARQGWLPWQ